MKKLIVILAVIAICLPVLAITENETQKLSRKCRKHPEKCQTAASDSLPEQKGKLNNLITNIQAGSSQEDVKSVLGVPNIVTKDVDGGELWIYDKAPAVSSYNKLRGSIDIGGLGIGIGDSGFGGGILGARTGSTVQASQNLKSIIIKFDKNSNVEELKYSD